MTKATIPVLELRVLLSFWVFGLARVNSAVAATHETTLCQQAGRVAVTSVLDKPTHWQTDRHTWIYSMTLSTRGHAVPTGTSITLSTDRHTQWHTALLYSIINRHHCDNKKAGKIERNEEQCKRRRPFSLQRTNRKSAARSFTSVMGLVNSLHSLQCDETTLYNQPSFNQAIYKKNI